jgi:hypothetical protein
MNKIINIKKDIEKVNALIDKRRKLMKQDPTDERLKLSLQSFEARQKVLYSELENEYNKLINEAKNVLEINSDIIESLIEIQEK